MVLFVFQSYPFCYFGKYINFALGTVRSERVKCFFEMFEHISHVNFAGVSVTKQYIVQCKLSKTLTPSCDRPLLIVDAKKAVNLIKIPSKNSSYS